MSYIKGNGYMRFNNRWFGYPKSGGETVDYPFCAVKHGGRYYFWAPSYNTMHNVIGGWPATGQLIHAIPNYRGVNDVRIYKVFEDTYKPCLFKASGSTLEQQTQALAIPGATFDVTVHPTDYTGNVNIVINDDPTNDALVSAYANLPLIKPKIVTYAIVCDKSGGYNDYRSPLSNQTNAQDFKTLFATKLGESWPGAASLNLELEAGDEAIEIQTSFTFPDMGYKLANQSKVNYQWINSNPYGLEASIISTEARFKTLNTMYFDTGSSVPRYETIENGIMVMNQTDITPLRKAAHFQCSYKNVDADSAAGTERIWGYVTVVVGLECGRMSLND